MEIMVRIIKNLSNDVVDLNTMNFKNATKTFNKPSFKWYNNPPTRKTLKSTKQAHLGQLINVIKANHNSSKDPKEDQ